MKRRYWVAAGMFAACIGVVLGLAAILQESGVSKAFNRVDVGMTAEEVEALFDTPPTLSMPVPFATESGDTMLWLRQWDDKDGSLAQVYFDERCGTVRSKTWLTSTETTGEKLRRWIRWPWW